MENGSALVKLYLTSWFYPLIVARRSGSLLRSAAILHENMEWSRGVSRPELAGIATVSQRGHEWSGGGTRGPGLFAIQATGFNERCFAGAKQ